MNNWNLHVNIFQDKKLNQEAEILLNDILKMFNEMIPEGPPLGIKRVEVINDHAGGPTLYWPLAKDHYRIGLNVSDLFYNQLAFQFTQEFCNLYCDPRIYNWFTELICHVASLYSLDYLSVKWEENPPSPELKEYWDNFDSYKSHLLGAAFSKVDMVKYQVSNEWVPYQINKLRNHDKLNRGKLLIIAYELLPLFKHYPNSWRLLPLMGKASEPAPPDNPEILVTNRHTKPDFQKLAEMAPENTQEFLTKLLGKCGITTLKSA